ncbi:hypothetical protein CspeluHIS016_0602020 [Cutaneotrichosporon spelunceum]|uniref:Thioredoxin-like fold domain-containing protein n=1 Tax=Cutaneotrichosporon spelunceum TaxID=1672016 RepID=A0AAD3YD30_9TREE|nr:hypothetical protein CspeluHIS016_0602020 [Cutaneotrichosporon spelunceum]
MASPFHKMLFSPPPSPPSEAADHGHLKTLTTSLVPRSKSPMSQRQHDVDIEAGEGVSKSFTQRNPFLAKLRLLVQRFTPNIPRPILRLLAFGVFLFIFTSFVSAVIWKPKAYVPPKEGAHPLVAPNPRAFRPNPHSFVLQSPANYLGDVDATKPLDAADLLGANAARRLGPSGSPRENKWLQELVDEHENSIVLWFGSNSPPQYALKGISERHADARRERVGRQVTLIPTVQRKDGEMIEAIFSRLGHDLSAAPVLVLGGEVIDATLERMEKMRESGSLSERLAQMGWTS